MLGRITAPYGVHGWVHVHPFGDDPAAWGGIGNWLLGPHADGAAAVLRRLEQIKPHAGGWVARFEGIEDRAGAEAIAGHYMAVTREQLPATVDNEYYWSDLIGLSVRNEQDMMLGTVESLVETGANAVLVVKDGDTTRLVPFVDQVVRAVDPATGCIRVDWGADW